MPEYDVLVVGGGILGLSTAYHLAREGMRVIVVDRTDAGQATAAGAGILSGEASMREDGSMYNLARRSFAYYPVLVDMLFIKSRIRVRARGTD